MNIFKELDYILSPKRVIREPLKRVSPYSVALVSCKQDGSMVLRKSCKVRSLVSGETKIMSKTHVLEIRKDYPWEGHGTIEGIKNLTGASGQSISPVGSNIINVRDGIILPISNKFGGIRHFWKGGLLTWDGENRFANLKNPSVKKLLDSNNKYAIGLLIGHKNFDVTKGKPVPGAREIIESDGFKTANTAETLWRFCGLATVESYELIEEDGKTKLRVMLKPEKPELLDELEKDINDAKERMTQEKTNSKEENKRLKATWKFFVEGKCFRLISEGKYMFDLPYIEFNSDRHIVFTPDNVKAWIQNKLSPDDVFFKKTVQRISGNRVFESFLYRLADNLLKRKPNSPIIQELKPKDTTDFIQKLIEKYRKMEEDKRKYQETLKNDPEYIRQKIEEENARYNSRFFR